MFTQKGNYVTLELLDVRQTPIVHRFTVLSPATIKSKFLRLWGGLFIARLPLEQSIIIFTV